MKTFSELKEGDKIYIWSPDPELTGVHRVDFNTPAGFLVKLGLIPVIGKIFNNGVLTPSPRKESYVKKIKDYFNPVACKWIHTDTFVFITTSEEEWIKKLENEKSVWFRSRR